MYVTVKERTREIGIKMAVGAHPGAIVLNFLLEAVVTVSIGGVLGVTMALGFIELFKIVPLRAEFHRGHRQTEPVVQRTHRPCLRDGAERHRSHGGSLPRPQASLVDPVEALRYE